MIRQTLQKDERVRKSAEFRRILRLGRRFRALHLLVVAFPKHSGRIRLGLTVSRKVGNAVVRNRVKRRLREVIRQNRSRLSRPWDLVIIAHPGAGGLCSRVIAGEVIPLLDDIARSERTVQSGTNSRSSQNRQEACSERPLQEELLEG